MKAMLIGFLAIFAIAIVADVTLSYAGFSAAEQSASDAVRLGS